VSPTKTDVAMSGNIYAVMLISTIWTILMIIKLLYWKLYKLNCIIE